MLRPQFYILKRTTYVRKVVFIMAYRKPEKEDRNKDNCSPGAVLLCSSAESQAMSYFRQNNHVITSLCTTLVIVLA